MRDEQVDTDVLIVGAGPVGLFLANECARRGLRWRLLETRAAQSEHSKALAIFPRTLEIFDMAGVVSRFLERANRVTSVAVLAHNHRLAHLRFAPEESPYRFIAMVPQNVTEQLLAEALRQKGGTIEYDTTFQAAEQFQDGVRVTAEQAGKRVQFHAAVVVGCDGAHSAVRHQLQIPFAGAEYKDLFALADIETGDALPPDELQLCPSEFGPVAIFPMSATRRRLVASVAQAEGEAPSLDLVRKILAERAPAGVEARALHWSSYFRIHHRQVAQLRVGRVFLAGDAAHIHSPFGGQGMNTGLHDVWNLAWKLELWLRGRGNERLLDSYNSERLPVIKNVIETTDFITKVMGTPNRLAQLLRDAVIPMVSRLAPFQHAFVQRLSELGIAYRGSPIVEGPGERYLDDSMRGGEGIRSRFLLLLGKHTTPATAEAARRLAGPLAAVVEVRTAPCEGIRLVRPDGYLAYAAQHRDGASAVQMAFSVLERQIHERSEIMEPRIKISSVSPGAFKAMLGLEGYLRHCGLERKLLDLLRLRISQINGCAFCLDMHWKELRAAGETEQRLYGLDAWRESPYYNERERAALAWAEAVTLVTEGHVPDAVFEEARRHFNEEELANLTLAIVDINGWNRLNIALRSVPGKYVAAQREAYLAAA